MRLARYLRRREGGWDYRMAYFCNREGFALSAS